MFSERTRSRTAVPGPVHNNSNNKRHINVIGNELSALNKRAAREKKNTIAYTISFFKFGTTDIFVLARVLRGVLSSQICF